MKVAAVAPADLDKPFGLKKPVASILLSVGTEKSESNVLRLGNPVDAAKPDGDRYARVERKDGPVVVGVLSGRWRSGSWPSRSSSATGRWRSSWTPTGSPWSAATGR